MPSRDRKCTYVHVRKGQASLRRLSLFRESGGGEAAAEAATARSEAEDAARLAQLERQRQEEQRRQIQDRLTTTEFDLRHFFNLFYTN